MTELKQKKTRTASAKERRIQLINATITSISKNGISGTTMGTVTKLAGLSAGLANFHFKSKDGLLEATLRHLAQEHRDHWRARLQSEELTAAEKLVAIIDAQFHPRISSRKNLTVWFAFFGEASARTSYRAITTSIDTERVEMLERLLRDIITQAQSPLCPKVQAQMLESLFDGYWLNMMMYPESYSREAARGHILQYLQGCFPQHFSPTAPVDAAAR